MLYTKQVPSKYETNVPVAGGGPSGVAASLTCESADTRCVRIPQLQKN